MQATLNGVDAAFELRRNDEIVRAPLSGGEADGNLAVSRSRLPFAKPSGDEENEMNSKLVRTVLTVLAISVAGVGLAACTQHGRGDRHHGWHDRHDHDRDRDRDRDRRGWDYRR